MKAKARGTPLSAMASGEAGGDHLELVGLGPEDPARVLAHDGVDEDWSGSWAPPSPVEKRDVSTMKTT